MQENACGSHKRATIAATKALQCTKVKAGRIVTIHGVADQMGVQEAWWPEIHTPLITKYTMQHCSQMQRGGY